jgi:hypothetical protein
MEKLLYGWFGEFGWEIMTAIPEVNALRGKYDVTVLSYPSVDGMYADMTDVKFISHGLELRASGMGKDYQQCNFKNADLNKYKYDKLRIHYHPDSIRPESRMPKVIRPDIPRNVNKNLILVHAREFPKTKTGRNWMDSYNELIDHLIDRGFEIGFIGLPMHSTYAEGRGADWRSDDINVAIRKLKEATLVIGPSSGTMVLAEWCLTPIYSWGCGDMRLFHDRKHGNLWNPFKTPHYHPWSGRETPDVMKLYCTSAYKPNIEDLKKGIEVAISSEKLES